MIESAVVKAGLLQDAVDCVARATVFFELLDDELMKSVHTGPVLSQIKSAFAWGVQCQLKQYAGGGQCFVNLKPSKPSKPSQL